MQPRPLQDGAFLCLFCGSEGDDVMDKMGFLGPAGTHSEEAARYLASLLPEDYSLAAFTDIQGAMQAVEDAEIESCLVPVENSLEGTINITLDMLAHSDVLVVERELVWQIHNQLMARCLPQEVRTVYSHAQPLAQCRGYLQEHYPAAELRQAASTAAAAELVAASSLKEGRAAICTRRAGEIYGLDTLAKEIQDNKANCTRFYQVCRRQSLAPVAAKTDRALVICQIDGARAGSLCGVLQEFAARGVNLMRIESRPARTKLGVYIFFFDLATDVAPQILSEAIEAVRQKSIWLKRLGDFPVLLAASRQGEAASEPDAKQ